MWRTVEGERKLEGAERRMFINAATDILEEIEEWAPEDLDFHAKILEQINHEDLWYVFMLTAEQLLNDDPPSELRAWNEAAVYEIYQHMSTAILIDIDTQHEHEGKLAFFNRRLVADAARQFHPSKKELAEMDPEDRPTIPRVNSTDADDWHFEVDSLLNRIIWDEDFLMYNTFADAPPQQAEVLKQMLGIEDEYYLDPPPVITPEAKERLQKLYQDFVKEANQHYQSFKKTGKIE